ncbi:SDR family oxidoreductase [Ktedonobacter sp. SOSP1-85]|uniref:SDR family oxidoreductase n=1 Tax=Ktedonobacter sp. SOSP1-85 TaxID=2778367 RepID=UPI001F172201|nr:SDR family oxidoreductase [Ktedonobacter sp. SOSP1-85]
MENTHATMFWQLPVELSAQEEQIVARIRRAKLFVLLRPLLTLAGKRNRAIQFTIGNPLLATQMSGSSQKLLCTLHCGLSCTKMKHITHSWTYDNFASLLAQYQRIVNVASVASVLTLSTGTPYGPSKAGVVQLTHQLANEWATQEVTVNAISPWFFKTSLNAKMLENEEFRTLLERRTPITNEKEPERQTVPESEHRDLPQTVETAKEQVQTSTSPKCTFSRMVVPSISNNLRTVASPWWNVLAVRERVRSPQSRASSDSHRTSPAKSGPR